MEEHEYVSVKQMRGSMSMVNIENPAAFLRGNYLKMLGSYTWREPGNGADDVLNSMAAAFDAEDLLKLSCKRCRRPLCAGCESFKKVLENPAVPTGLGLIPASPSTPPSAPCWAKLFRPAGLDLRVVHLICAYPV